MGGAQMMNQLEPLVATDQRIDPVQAQHRHLNTGAGEPVQVKGFESGLGMPVEGRKQHGSRPGKIGRHLNSLAAGDFRFTTSLCELARDSGRSVNIHAAD
ncbi:hypothetical protein THH46_10715 [Pseudomonas sp. NA13]